MKEYTGGFTANPPRADQQAGQQSGGAQDGGGTTAPRNSPILQPLDPGGPLRRMRRAPNLASMRGW